MRLRISVGLLLIVALGVGLVAVGAPGGARGDAPAYTTYAGTDKVGDNVVVNYSEQNHKVDLYFYEIPLDQTHCPGQSVNLILPDVTVTNDSFDEYDGVQGANGTYATSAAGAPIVTGTIYLAQGQACATSMPYFAGVDADLEGDIDCSWKTPFQVDSVDVGQPQGGSPTPAPKDPSKAVTIDDAYAVIKYLAGVVDDEIADCPFIGKLVKILFPAVQPPQHVQGDVDCSGDGRPE